MNFFYIAELNIPNNSAYMQHVKKMCDELSVNNKTTLIVFSKNTVVNKLMFYLTILPMTEFELRTPSVGSNCSAN